MQEPYSIKIHVVNGDPEGFRIIEQMNWTGQGFVFPRSEWLSIKSHEGFSRPGVYLLLGYEGEDDDLLTLYIGEGDGVRGRLDEHFKNKDFWTWAVSFVSTNNSLNKAHIQWLEFALIARAKTLSRCRLGNANTPNEPVLSPGDRSDTAGFLKEILQILPLVGVRAFEKPKTVVPDQNNGQLNSENGSGAFDTIVVPAIQEGFDKVFLGENRWYAVRISAGAISKIRYVAAYRSAPVSAITHIAEVASIMPYGESGKYQILFKGPAEKIKQVVYDQIPGNQIQGIRYTTKNKLMSAAKISDLLPWGG